MLNRNPSVQECDARDGEGCNADRFIIIMSYVPIILLRLSFRQLFYPINTLCLSWRIKEKGLTKVSPQKVYELHNTITAYPYGARNDDEYVNDLSLQSKNRGNGQALNFFVSTETVGQPYLRDVAHEQTVIAMISNAKPASSLFFIFYGFLH